MKDQITIFTPTYNREKTLPRLYNSLVSQTNRNFEWLIVDDGSIDNTKDLIEKWRGEENIDIKYIYQENHGKIFAYNVGAKNAKYKWFLCLDSDDFLKDNAVETILNLIEQYDDNDYVGLISLRENIDNDNITVNNKLSTGKLISFAELYRKYKCNGDTAIIYKTEILENNLFPIVEGEKFVPEQYIHDRMDLEGNLLFFSTKVYCGEYLKDGYSNNTVKLLKNNPQGYLIAANQRLKYSKLLRNKFLGAVQVNMSNFILNKKILKILKDYKFFEKILILITRFPSYLYYVKKYKKEK